MGLGTTQREEWKTSDTIRRRGLARMRSRLMRMRKKAVSCGDMMPMYMHKDGIQRHNSSHRRTLWRYPPAQLKFKPRSVYAFIRCTRSGMRAVWYDRPDGSCSYKLSSGMNTMLRIETQRSTQTTSRHTTKRERRLVEYENLLVEWWDKVQPVGITGTERS